MKSYCVGLNDMALPSLVLRFLCDLTALDLVAEVSFVNKGSGNRNILVTLLLLTTKHYEWLYININIRGRDRFDNNIHK